MASQFLNDGDSDSDVDIQVDENPAPSSSTTNTPPPTASSSSSSTFSSSPFFSATASQARQQKLDASLDAIIASGLSANTFSAQNSHVSAQMQSLRVFLDSAATTQSYDITTRIDRSYTDTTNILAANHKAALQQQTIHQKALKATYDEVAKNTGKDYKFLYDSLQNLKGQVASIASSLPNGPSRLYDVRIRIDFLAECGSFRPYYRQTVIVPAITAQTFPAMCLEVKEQVEESMKGKLGESAEIVPMSGHVTLGETMDKTWRPGYMVVYWNSTAERYHEWFERNVYRGAESVLSVGIKVLWRG